ncbi:hypothetical protein B0H14DRAFT_2642575 [Mycena olivaceomarginata]|nr:hypothetical protein B0H14DRAFT_2642575 [Mycena olivaceomarginata]
MTQHLPVVLQPLEETWYLKQHLSKSGPEARFGTENGHVGAAWAAPTSSRHRRARFDDCDENLKSPAWGVRVGFANYPKWDAQKKVHRLLDYLGTIASIPIGWATVPGSSSVTHSGPHQEGGGCLLHAKDKGVSLDFKKNGSGGRTHIPLTHFRPRHLTSSSGGTARVYSGEPRFNIWGKYLSYLQNCRVAWLISRGLAWPRVASRARVVLWARVDVAYLPIYSTAYSGEADLFRVSVTMTAGRIYRLFRNPKRA